MRHIHKRLTQRCYSSFGMFLISDLEAIDEFETDEANLEMFLRVHNKPTPQFIRQIADKTLLVGLTSTVFRDAKYTSHEVTIDKVGILQRSFVTAWMIHSSKMPYANFVHYGCPYCCRFKFTGTTSVVRRYPKDASSRRRMEDFRVYPRASKRFGSSRLAGKSRYVASSFDIKTAALAPLVPYSLLHILLKFRSCQRLLLVESLQ